MRVLGWRLRHWLGLVTAAGVLAVLPVVIHGPDFYYIDDMQTQFMPAFHEIGRQLWQGELPLISLRSWFGGNLVGEYQYAIFNPVSDLLYMLLYSSDFSFGLQATILASLHLVSLAGGTFALCRSLQSRFWEALYASIVISSSIWLIYWASMSWMPLLVALSWCSWAMAALLRLQENRRWLSGTVILIAMVGVSGSPQIDLVLALFCAVAALQLMIRRENAAFFAVTVASILGLCLAMPALLPLIETFRESARPAVFASGSYFLPPQALIAFGLPIFVSAWPDWDGVWRTVGLPQAYIDWAFPLLALSAIANRKAWHDRHFRLLICCAAVLLCLAMIPGISPLRYPTRFFPGVALMGLLAIARHLALRREDSMAELGWSWPLVACAIGVPALIVVMISPSFPSFVPGILMGTVAAFGAATLTITLPAPCRTHWPVLLCLLHVIFFIGLVIEWPTNPGVTRFAMNDDPGNIPATPPGPVFADGGNTLLLYRHLSKPDYQSDSTKLYGNAAFALGGRDISGYSALGPKSVVDLFGFLHLGYSTPHDVHWLFAIEPTTSVPYVDLLRIDRILAETPDWADQVDKVAPANWTRQQIASGLLFSTPSKVRNFAGSLSFLPPGVTGELSRFEDGRESWHVTVNDHYDGRPLIFARAWYPGYRATLNGTAVDLQHLAGIVPAVILPAGFKGTVELRFLPQSLVYGCILALLAGLAALGLQYLWRRSGRPCGNPPVVV